MKFSPRRDVWLSIVIWLCIAVLLLCALTPFFVEGAGVVGSAFIFLLCLLCAGFMAWLWLATFYVFEFIHISPLDEERFLAELKKRCPQLRME